MNRNLRKLFLGIVLGISLFAGTIYAQSINVDSAKVRVKIGTYITGTNNLIVSNDSGVVNNSGTMIISGNITNSGKIISDGFEYLNGTSDQTITGVFGTSHLGNVFRNQPANTNVVAGSDLVMRTFDFGSTDGFMDASHSSGRTVRILDSTDTAIKNYSSTKYFNVGNNYGTLERAVATLNTLSFPVGNSTAEYRLLDYHPTSLGSSGSNFAGLKIINGSPSSSPSPPSYIRNYTSGFQSTLSGSGCAIGAYNGTIMFNCLTDDYWSLAVPSDYQYFVKAFENDVCYDPADGYGTRRVLKVSAVTNAWFSVANIENVVTTPSLSSNFCLYSDWKKTSDTVIGGIYQGSGLLAIAAGKLYVLPVELTSLSAKAGQSEIVLDWETASESNTDRFEVLRSINAIDFQKIGETFAYGNSNSPREYQLIDENVEVGIEYYYKLKQVDYDDKFTLSKVVSAEIAGISGPELKVFPNPTNGLVNVNQFFETAYVINLVGQQVGLFQNSNSVDLGSLPAGVYILQVRTEKQDKTFKIQKL